ncbi:hypothetical protein E5Q_01352 [Mixia osmundae IAM 14324]|uniref:Ribosome maturation protein SDO1/SBDS N-terminal domain-containing protein n=1 Tax=Mixia osmundae (strain CBS 9802 / IAM 14324 / JCM 22182 / KY 12970) TaxID=764103 RepID=G7DVT9_MIXOS|nr:hypothetical protein E5Q_01352 [Mixia osmundae IAM 14324]
MAKGTNKVVYKPDSQSTDEFMVIIEDAAALKKWKAGETSIPLTEIVDSFDVLHSGQGSQGILGRPSNQELDSVFGTHNQDEVVEMILKKGALQGGDAPEKTASKNDSHCAEAEDSRSQKALTAVVATAVDERTLLSHDQIHCIKLAVPPAICLDS